MLKHIKNAVCSFFEGLGIIVFSLGAGLVVYKIYFWLRYAECIRFPFLHVLQLLPKDSWIYKPNSWYGLHKIVTWLLSHVPNAPLPVLFIFTGLIFIYIGMKGKK